MRAVLDADVLYPLPLRDTLLALAELDAFQLVWSAQILDEVIRNLIADQRLTESSALTMLAALRRAFPEAAVGDFEHLIDTMPNHPKDRHVAACAVVGGANLIVTGNLKDFKALPSGLVAVSPDAFLQRIAEDLPAVMERALALQAARLKRPPLTVGQILGKLALAAPNFVANWRKRAVDQI